MSRPPRRGRTWPLAIRQIPDPRFRQLLIPLLYDSHPEVATEAMRSVRALGASDQLFVPTLVSLLRHRSLKSSARDALVGYGEGVLDTLAYLLRDPGDDIWVRRHIPATIARIPAQKSVDILIEALKDPDSFLRYKAVTGLEKLHRDHPELTIDRQPIEALASREALVLLQSTSRSTTTCSIARDCPADGLLADALQEKMARAVDRVYRLLGLIYPWKDIGAARYAIEHGEARLRASALEYVDNLLSSAAPQAPDAARRRRRRSTRRCAGRTSCSRRDPAMPKKRCCSSSTTTTRSWPRRRSISSRSGSSGPWRTTSSSCSRTGTRRIGTCSKPPPGRSQRTACRRTGAAAFGSSRCPWCSLRHACAVCRCSRRCRSPSCSESPAAGARFGYESGRILYQEGAVPEQLQFVLDGTVTAKADGEDARHIVPPAALGFEQILEGRAMPETIRTAETTVCLALSHDELRTLISTNTDLVEGLFRMLAGGPQAVRPAGDEEPGRGGTRRTCPHTR